MFYYYYFQVLLYCLVVSYRRQVARKAFVSKPLSLRNNVQSVSQSSATACSLNIRRSNSRQRQDCLLTQRQAVEQSSATGLLAHSTSGGRTLSRQNEPLEPVIQRIKEASKGLILPVGAGAGRFSDF